MNGVSHMLGVRGVGELDREAAMRDHFQALLQEKRVFPPLEEFRREAHGRDPSIYEQAERDPEGFWARMASELQWQKPWETVLEWEPPHARWFNGGELNVSQNCLDRHLEGPRRNKAALIWEGEDGDTRTYTYHQLAREVRRFANVLKNMGVKKGDCVTLYLPMIPELVIACLACTRIGAPHSVVFGGFSADSLRDRINDARSKVLITADAGWRRGRLIPLKQNANEALTHCPTVENVIVVERIGREAGAHFVEGRDHWWHVLMNEVGAHCPPEPMDAEDVLFILYTSGTTGRPKGIVHTTGGYLTEVAATAKYVFDLKDDDVY